MRKYLYKFFDKFTLVDVIFIFAIVGLGLFSWNKYNESLELTKRLATQKLLIASDVETKSMQSWFRDREEELSKLTDLYQDSPKLFAKRVKELSLDKSILNIYLTDEKNKKIYTLKKDDLSINLSNVPKTANTLCLGFHQKDSLTYVVLTKPVYDKKENYVASLTIKINATYVTQLFHTENEYKSYMYDSNYFIISLGKKMDTKLVVAFESDKRIDEHIFEHIGYELNDVIGSFSPVNLYGYEVFVVNEVAKDVVYKGNYENRDKILLVLLVALFFALYMMMHQYKKRMRKAQPQKEDTKPKKQHKEVSKTIVEEQKEESKSEDLKEDVILWDTKAFASQFTDMEDMMETIISLFQEDTPEQLKNLKSALEAEDYKKIKLFAHTIKGSAANLSALEIVKRAQELENLAVAKSDMAEISLKHDAFVQCCLDTMKLMDNFSIKNDEDKSIELSKEEKKEQLNQLKNNLENSVYVESANFTVLKIKQDDFVKLKYAVDSFDTQTALALIEKILKEEG